MFASQGWRGWAVLGLGCMGMAAGIAASAREGTSARERPTWAVSVDAMKETVATLAQPAWEGRRAGTPGAAKARAWVEDRYRALGIVGLGGPHGYEQPMGSRRKPWGVNVLGYFGPLEAGCVLIGAHYDGKGIVDGVLFPGADDNASGVAAMLEMARLLRAREGELRKCVILAAFDYEEGSAKTGGGIKGSRYFAKRLAAGELMIPRERVELGLIMDLVGGEFFHGMEDVLFLFGAEGSAALRALHAETPGRASLDPRLLSIALMEPLGTLVPRSDYGPLRDIGIPYVFATTGTPAYYHRAGDGPEVVNYAKLGRVTGYLLDYLWPVVTGQVRVVAGEAAADRRVADSVVALDVIERLLARAEENGVPEPMRRRIAKDRENLLARRVDDGARLRNCDLQLSFVDVLGGLGVTGTGTWRWLTSLIAAGCP